MLQFYFLSILLNLIIGLILVYATNFMAEESAVAATADGTDSTDESDENVEDSADDAPKSAKNIFANPLFFDDPTFRLVTAILSALVGLMKLLSTVQGDMPLIGDLIPAVAGLAGAFALLIEYYSQKSDVGFNLPVFLTSIFVGGRKYLGIFCILAGILHFIFPRVLFL